MGIPLLWAFIRQEGYNAALLCEFSQGPLPPDSVFRIDILATFFSFIQRLHTSTSIDPPTCNIIFERHLVSCKIPKESSILYIDGASPEEKRETRLTREAKRAIALQKAQTSIGTMEGQVRSGRGVRKQDFNKLTKHIRAAFYWSPESRASLKAYLVKQGWNLAECPSEADIAIADDCQLNDIVVSADSDMLLYDSVRTIWRPLSKGRFLVYQVLDLLKHLGISRQKLTVLGIVSKNDYTANLSRMGVATNFKIIKSLEETGTCTSFCILSVLLVENSTLKLTDMLFNVLC
jgi:hypothetical protein